MTATVQQSSRGRLSNTVRRAADACAQTLERRPYAAFVWLTLLYAVVVLVLSSVKLLWFDELITLTVVRMGSLPAIWQGLKLGVDPNPPLFLFLVSLSRNVFGESATALRLPAAVGYWIGLAALYTYLQRRTPAVWATAGTLLSMAMAPFDYSYESRSYGMVYGMAMLSFLCWSIAVAPGTSGRSQAAATAGMGLALILGVCSNYFAVLAVAPIAVGEVWRTLRVGREERVQAVRWSIWLALLAGTLPLLLFRSLIEHAIAQFAPYAWNRVSLQALATGYTEMVESTLPPLAAVLLVAGCLLLIARSRQTAGKLSALQAFAGRFARQRPTLPSHEAVGVATLMAYPVLGYLAASLHGGMLSSLFVNPVCLGFAIAGTAVLYRLAAGNQRVGVALLCLWAAWFCARESFVAYTYAKQRTSFHQVEAALRTALQHADADAVLAVPDPLLAMSLEHYAAPDLRARLVFPLDLAAVRRYRHDDSPEQNLWAGRNLLPALHMQSLDQLKRRAGDDLIIAADNSWLLQELAQQHRTVTRVPVEVNAPDIGGFTPLAHGPLAVYMSTGSGAAVEIQPAP